MREAREWRGTLSRKNCGDNFVRCVRHKRRAARDHLVQYDSETPDVAPLVDLVTARLLWRHVCNRTHYNSGSSLETGRCLTVDGRCWRRRREDLCQSKVEDFHQPVIFPNDDVVRFDVAVNYVNAMRRYQRGSNLDRNFQSVV